jgi:hypothetical protein
MIWISYMMQGSLCGTWCGTEARAIADGGRHDSPLIPLDDRAPDATAAAIANR